MARERVGRPGAAADERSARGEDASLDTVRLLYQELPRTRGFSELMEGGVDSPAVFKRLDGSVTHFVDIFHLSPEGEEVVGGAYFEVLRDHFRAAGERPS